MSDSIKEKIVVFFILMIFFIAIAQTFYVNGQADVYRDCLADGYHEIESDKWLLCEVKK